MASKTGGHRPPKFTDPAVMQAKIDEYFTECEGRVLKDQNGETVYDKFGYPVVVDRKPLTITGLALALGFTNRQSLLNYQAKPPFTAIIERAKLQIENYAEMRLYDKDGANGAKFNLQNNFCNWNADKAAQEGEKGPTVNIICDIPRTAAVAQDQSEDAIDPQAIGDMLKKLEEGKQGDE